LGGAGYYFTTRAVFVCAAACQWLAILKNSWHGTKIIQEKNKKKLKIQNAGHTSFIDRQSINNKEMRAKKRSGRK